jgi:hypothetical protein
MLYRVWLLAVIGATGLTAVWMFATTRLQIATLFATGLWSFAFVASDSLELFNATAGATRAVDVGAFAYVLLAFALLSMTAFIGTVVGFYPPDVRELSDDDLRGEPASNRQ